MIRPFLSCVLLFAPALLANDPVSAEEAQQRLQQRQAERKNNPEADELRQTIADLRAEISDLKRQLAKYEHAQVASATQPAAQTTTRPAAKKVYKSIEIGMTRDDLTTFLSHHPEAQIIGREVTPAGERLQILVTAAEEAHGQISQRVSVGRRYSRGYVAPGSSTANGTCNVSLTNGVVTGITQ